MTDKHKKEVVEKEQYLRLAADFENYKKSMEKQLVEMSKFASAAVVLKMVEVMDHMDHAMAHATNAVQAESEWFAGLRKVDEEFHKTMKEFGVERIETKEKQFDPETMEAVSMVDGQPEQSQQVQSEVRAGWTMHGRIIRPARVIVYK